MNATEIVKRVDSLPELPQILARDMYVAQGWKPSTEERAAIKARADFFEEMGMSRDVHIRVVDVYNPKCKIGELIFWA